MAENLRSFHPSLDQYHIQRLAPVFAQFESLISDAQLLHILAVAPERVLPPGKNLASIFSAPTTSADHPDGDAKSKIEKQVSDVVHKAFWAEVRTGLSDTMKLADKLNKPFDVCPYILFYRL